MKINFIQSESMLFTQRSHNTTFLAMVLALSGSLFGILEIFGRLLGLSENAWTRIQKKIMKFKISQLVKCRRNRLNENFKKNEIIDDRLDVTHEFKCSAKIHPIDTKVSNY